MSVSKAARPDPARVGKKVFFHVTVTNAGPDTAFDVTLTDTFQVNSGVAPGEPRNYRFHWAKASHGSCDASDAEGTITCNLGNVRPGSTVRVRLAVTPLEAGVLHNTAYAFSEIFSDDPDTSNNQASVDTATTR